jgi:hypothetical protein
MAKPQRLLRVSHSKWDAVKALIAAAPAMRSGFNVNTHAGNMSVNGDDAQALADLLVERLNRRVAGASRAATRC